MVGIVVEWLLLVNKILDYTSTYKLKLIRKMVNYMILELRD